MSHSINLSKVDQPSSPSPSDIESGAKKLSQPLTQQDISLLTSSPSTKADLIFQAEPPNAQVTQKQGWQMREKLVVPPVHQYDWEQQGDFYSDAHEILLKQH